MQGHHVQDSRLSQNLAIVESVLFLKREKSGHKLYTMFELSKNLKTISLRNAYKNRHKVKTSMKYCAPIAFLAFTIYFTLYQSY